MKIGICSASSQQVPNGLTPCLRYSSIWAPAMPCLSSLNFSCSFFSSGASCCIRRLVIACLRLTGNITPRTANVRQMMHTMYGMNR